MVLLDILYKLTGGNKKLVTAFRVKYLLQLRSKLGDIVELDNLLKKYKFIAPKLVTLVSTVWGRRVGCTKVINFRQIF